MILGLDRFIFFKAFPSEFIEIHPAFFTESDAFFGQQDILKSSQPEVIPEGNGPSGVNYPVPGDIHPPWSRVKSVAYEPCLIAKSRHLGNLPIGSYLAFADLFYGFPYL